MGFVIFNACFSLVSIILKMALVALASENFSSSLKMCFFFLFVFFVFFKITKDKEPCVFSLVSLFSLFLKKKKNSSKNRNQTDPLVFE